MYNDMMILFNILNKTTQYHTIITRTYFLRFLGHMIKIQMQICGEKQASLERSWHVTSVYQRLRV